MKIYKKKRNIKKKRKKKKETSKNNETSKFQNLINVSVRQYQNLGNVIIT